jgi:selenophosphate synthase
MMRGDFAANSFRQRHFDVYAMGGRPVMAIAVLGWPIDKLPPK